MLTDRVAFPPAFCTFRYEPHDFRAPESGIRLRLAQAVRVAVPSGTPCSAPSAPGAQGGPHFSGSLPTSCPSFPCAAGGMNCQCFSKQDLLQLQYEGVAVMKLFDRAKVNVNLLIFLLNKKFYGK